MGKLKKAVGYYKDVKTKRKYFPNSVLNWQLAGKFLGQVPHLIGEKTAKYFYEKRHKVTVDFLVNNFHEFINQYDFFEANTENSKIIWTLWWQGYENAPEIVKYCLDNMKIYAHKNGFEFFCLDQQTFKEFVDFPDYLEDKIRQGNISIANISDIIRVSLLAKYGGTWIDSTVFIQTSFDWTVFNRSYFTLKTGEITDYSPNIAKNRWKSFLLSGNSSLYAFTRDFFFEYFKKYDFVVDYLLIDYIFELAFQRNSNIRNQMLDLEITNPNLFWLEKHFEDTFEESLWKEISKETKIFKTTYKLSERTKENKNNFYTALINKKL